MIVIYMGIAECRVYMTGHKDQSLPVMKQINPKIMRFGLNIDQSLCSKSFFFEIYLMAKSNKQIYMEIANFIVYMDNLKDQSLLG